MSLLLRKNSTGNSYAEYMTFISTTEMLTCNSLKELLNQKAKAFTEEVRKTGREVVGEISIEIQQNFLRKGDDVRFFAEVRKK